jgi:hypothetical protein
MGVADTDTIPKKEENVVVSVEPDETIATKNAILSEITKIDHETVVAVLLHRHKKRINI